MKNFLIVIEVVFIYISWCGIGLFLSSLLSMRTTDDYIIANEVMDANTIVFDAYGTLLTPSKLHVRNLLEDFSKHKQHEIYRALKKAQDFDEVIEIIPFHSKKEKEKFISTVKKDLENIQPYDESFAVLGYLKDKYTLMIDSNLIPPYDEPIKENFGKVVDDLILSFQECYSKGDRKHYESLKKRFGKSGEEFLFVGDSYKNDYIYPKKE